MNATYGRLSLVLALVLAAAGCSAAPANGPSAFLDAFAPAAIESSINSIPDGPRCPGDSEYERSQSDQGWDGGSSGAVLTTSCDDPGDGTELAQAWAAGIDAELRRLRADVLATGTATTATGVTVTDKWEYRSDRIQGRITVSVLVATTGGYQVIVRIVEPT